MGWAKGNQHYFLSASAITVTYHNRISTQLPRVKYDLSSSSSPILMNPKVKIGYLSTQHLSTRLYSRRPPQLGNILARKYPLKQLTHCL